MVYRQTRTYCDYKFLKTMQLQSPNYLIFSLVRITKWLKPWKLLFIFQCWDGHMIIGHFSFECSDHDIMERLCFPGYLRKWKNDSHYYSRKFITQWVTYLILLRSGSNRSGKSCPSDRYMITTPTAYWWDPSALLFCLFANTFSGLQLPLCVGW